VKEKTGNTNHEPRKRISGFRFYEELNDFLPPEYRKKQFEYEFTGTPSIKNTIEAIGIPHAEVDLIVINGNSVDFDFLIRGGEFVSVYPVFENFDISPVVRLRPKPLRKTKFIVDVNLGKLAPKLRLLGFDTLFRNDYEDDEIVRIAGTEKRIILTRDKGLLKHTEVTHGYWLRNDNPKMQLREVVNRLQLNNCFQPFTRCSNCNNFLETVNKNVIKTCVHDDTFGRYDLFWKCKGCGNVYWRGSHYDKICEWVDELRNI